jgi:hypothetical protein
MIEAGVGSDPFQVEYGGSEKNFVYWLKAGAAFTLPLIVVALITLITIIVIFTQPA